MRPLPSALLVASLLACASSPAPPPASDDVTAEAPHTPRPRRNANVIMRDELADPSLEGATGLEVVRRLRPTFLTRRGATSLRDPDIGIVKVSLDGINLGPIDDLDRVRANEILSIRYLTASDATQRFGILSNGSPVILVERM